ncbi:MAG: TetR/AcrR family transcriptional regulator [Chitinophagales bacterium]|nr:TetR/AcrR family transcriptional regulator [Chitinophagales bacterium]MDW8427290.1 TetR/AcrR family transcriptional regulator [Chitinophagales bacterium]
MRSLPRQRVLEVAERLFFSYGIHSVTMDDISRELHVSKKTLYRFFTDKSELVDVLVEKHIKRLRHAIKQVEAAATDPVSYFLMSMQLMAQELQRFHAPFVYDLQKYYPRSWKRFQRFIRTELTEVVERNLGCGMTTGHYRSDLKSAILSRFRIEQIFLAANPEFFPPEQFSIETVQLELARHFLHGILTEKGRQQLRNYERNQLKNKEKI